MWYFTWILGVCLAASAGIINALWYEQDNRLQSDEELCDQDKSKDKDYNKIEEGTESNK